MKLNVKAIRYRMLDLDIEYDKDLAKRAGMTQQQLNKILKMRSASLRNVGRLCRALQMTPNEILCVEE